VRQHSPLSDNEVLKSTLQAGSKSFSFSSYFFGRETYHAVTQLYSWCRFCDDWIDRASERLPATETQLTDGQLAAHTERAAEELFEWTTAVLNDRALPASLSEKTSALPFISIGALAKKYQIPHDYFFELLEGMKFDALGGQIVTEQDLDLYCFRVAGVVGLIMCHIMGLRRDSALGAALDTGLAMQMTNIARDIKDDFALNRIYLPTNWFETSGRKRPELKSDFDPANFTGAVVMLLKNADRRYQSGRLGLDALPWLSALAVGSAQSIYQDIGRIVLTRGVNAWAERAHTSKLRKLILAGGFLGRALPTIAFRRLTSLSTGIKIHQPRLTVRAVELSNYITPIA
jgi:15-cis-phytoene synthase